MLLVAPFFSSSRIPRSIRGVIVIVIGYVVFSAAQYQYDFTNGTDIFPFVFGEVFIGMFMGYVVLILYYSAQLTGFMIDFIGGLMLAASYDPVNNTQASIYGRLYNLLFMILFVIFDGPFFMIDALVKSYEGIPYVVISNGIAFEFVVDVFTKSFIYGIQLGIPIVIILFITDLSVGLLSRTIPQINVFIIGAPIKLLVGYVVTMLFLFPIVTYMSKIIELIAETIYTFSNFV
jgi:flagellar biosynthetic protein FliR